MEQSKFLELQKALEGKRKAQVKRLLPKGNMYLSIPETLKLFDIIFENRMSMEWVRIIVERGTRSGILLKRAIENDYPLTDFLNKGQRITADMMIGCLNGEGFINSLESLLAKGGNPKVRSNALLKEAVNRLNYAAVQLLLEYGADPEAISERTKKALKKEIYRGDEGAVATWMALNGAKIPLLLEFK